MHHAESKPLPEAIDEKQPILQSSKWAYSPTRFSTPTPIHSSFVWTVTYPFSTLDPTEYIVVSLAEGQCI